MKLLQSGLLVDMLKSSLRESFTVGTMTRLTATVYLCHKWLRVWSVCRKHNPVLSLFMTYHRVCNKSYTTVSWIWAAHPSGALENSLPVFRGVRLSRALVFCVVFCWLLLVLVVIVLTRFFFIYSLWLTLLFSLNLTRNQKFRQHWLP